GGGLALLPFELPPTIPQPATPRIATITRARMRIPTRWATLIGPPGGLKKLPMKPRSTGGGGGEPETFAAGLGLGFGAGASGAGASGAGASGAGASSEGERSGTFSPASEGSLPDVAASSTGAGSSGGAG